MTAEASLSTIEQTIIDRATRDEEQRAALWLFAEALKGQPHSRVGVNIPEPV